MAINRNKKVLPSLTKTLLAGFGAAISTATNLPFGDWGAVSSHLVDLADALGLKASSGDLAGKLIFTAAQQAMGSVVGELLRQGVTTEELNTRVTQIDSAHLIARVQELLENAHLAVSENFFKNPARVLPLADIADLLAHELGGMTLSPPQVRATVQLFENDFVEAIRNKWMENWAKYETLLKDFQSPFDEAWDTIVAWERYQKHLIEDPRQPMMGETFGLEAVYIELRAYFTVKKRQTKGQEASLENHVVNAHKAIDDWLAKNDKNDAIRLVSGGPGSGKSSFAKMLAAKMAHNKQRVVLVPLDKLDRKAFPSSVGAFLRASGLLPFDPLDQPDKPLLLILDGLDELSLQGDDGVKAAIDLMFEVNKFMKTVNYLSLRLRCLVTGRDLAVQGVERENPLPKGATLHLLPYYVLSKDIANPVDRERLLRGDDADQRDAWWRKYGQASGHGFDGLPAPIRGNKKLDELSGQPLLNYLLAVMYVQKPADLDTASRCSLYRKLLAGVHTRQYADNQPHPALGTLDLDGFFFILEKIAIAIWQGNGRTASLAEIGTHCQTPQVLALLNVLLVEINKGLMRMLAAFYFRQALLSGASETFEFTHKSFGEYLTARHMVGMLKDQCDEKHKSEDNLSSSWNATPALVQWIGVCGPQPLDEGLLDFIKELIAEKPKDQVLEWQRFCAQLIAIVLRNGMPMERCAKDLTFKEQCRQSRNAETALLVMHCACAERTREVSIIDWPAKNSLRTWLSWLESSGEMTLARSALAFLNIPMQELQFVLLFKANLEGANLEGANLEKANIRQANLKNVNLYHANLKWAKLKGANLESANLGSANLKGAVLKDAILKIANFERANLAWSKLKGAIFCDTNLHKADLTRSDIAYSTLEAERLLQQVLQ